MGKHSVFSFLYVGVPVLEICVLTTRLFPLFVSLWEDSVLKDKHFSFGTDGKRKKKKNNTTGSFPSHGATEPA